MQRKNKLATLHKDRAHLITRIAIRERNHEDCSELRARLKWTMTDLIKEENKLERKQEKVARHA